MRTPDRRSFDNPRRPGRGRDRDDGFPSRDSYGERSFGDRPEGERSYGERSSYDRPSFDRPSFGSRGPAVASGPELGAVVKWFNAEKGFGFVELEGGGGDAFLHVSVLSRVGHQTVAPGTSLRVRTSPGQKGPQVAEVTHVSDEPPAPGYDTPPSRGPRPPRNMDPTGPTTEVRGTVKWFNAEKGFGFVMPEGGGKDVFVHITALNRNGLSGLEPNQTVRLQVADGRRGPEAVSVELA